MKTKTFEKILIKTIEDDGRFITNSIDMKNIKGLTKAFGFDDAVCVVGEDMDEVFILCIKKVK